MKNTMVFVMKPLLFLYVLIKVDVLQNAHPYETPHDKVGVGSTDGSSGDKLNE